MAKVRIYHPDKGTQKTYLTAEVAADATSSTVENNDGFATDDLVMFGDYGQEKSEIVTLTSTTNEETIGHTTGPNFAHSERTPVYEMAYDQADLYSASSEGGTYSLVDTIDLDVDEKYTLYDHATGGSSTWYKFRYKNSVSLAYSSYSDEIQGSGYATNSLGSMTEEVLESYGDPLAEELSKDQIARYLNGGVRRLVMKIIKMYPDYFGAYTTQALTADTTYDYPTRFIGFQRVDIGSSRTSSYPVDFISETNLDPTRTFTETAPKIVLRDATWKTYPDCSGKTAYIVYWQYPAVMDSDSDTHGLPYGGRDVLVTYALYKAWMDKDADKAKSINYLLRDQMDEYMEFVGQSRQASNNWFQEVSSGDDLYDWNPTKR